MMLKNILINLINRYSIYLLIIISLTSCTHSNQLKVLDLPVRPLNPWWQELASDNNDQIQINEIINQLINQNLEIQSAKAKLAEAYYYELEMYASLYPELKLNGNQYFGQVSIFNQNSINLNGSWSLDLFGKKRAQYLSSYYSILENLNTKDAVTNAIIASCLENILNNNLFRDLILKQQEIIHLQKEIITLENDNYQSGLTDLSSLNNAQNTLLEYNKILNHYQSSLKISLYSLEALTSATAITPTTFNQKNLNTIKTSLSKINIKNIGKSNMLNSRPDVLAAWNNMLKFNQNLKSTTANLWPDISILAFFGAIQKSTSAIWFLDGTFDLPLMNFGELRAAVKVAKQELKAAELSYEQSIVNAIKDSKIALTNYLNAYNDYQTTQQELIQSKTNLQLTENLYQAGLVDAIYYFNNKIKTLTLEEEVLELKYLSLQNYVILATSLGKSFTPSINTDIPF